MILLHNGRIYTQNPSQPVVSGLWIDRETVRAAGSLQVDKINAEKEIQVINLEGKTVLPGLVDSHIHLSYYALGLVKVDCETKTLAECLERVTERARSTPSNGWVFGHGWNQNDWSGGFPSARDLDQITPNHPVYLTAKSLHAGWVNSIALRICGIGLDTPDPEGGKIGRFASGEPDGILYEAAMELVEEKLPEVSADRLESAMRSAIQHLWKSGLTGAHDFDQRECFTALQTLHQRGELNFRVVKSIAASNLPHAISLGLKTGFGDRMLRIGSVKLFADGALGPQTAAMLKPYEGSQDSGILLLDEEQVLEFGIQAAQSGISLAIHAIGDQANHVVLNGLQGLRSYEVEKDLPKLRHRIEHVQIIHPDDIPRLASLNVIASMQPIHATSDMLAADRYWGSRSSTAYAWKELEDAGTQLTFGSDAPVESPNPFWGLHAAVTRQRQDGSPGKDGWYPNQRLALDQAIRAYTRGAAFAAGTEAWQGQLAPGFAADLIVLDQDPYQVPVEALFSLQPAATMVGGRWVWNNSLEL